MSHGEIDRERINPRLRTNPLDEVDRVWKEYGFNSQSEFVRYILRDAVRYPELTRGEWRGIAIGEHDIRHGNTYSSDSKSDELNRRFSSGLRPIHQ